MNTPLLTTSNSSCTAKGLKMMAAVMFLTAVFVFTNQVAVAQETKQDLTGVNPALPYANYKGIKDVKQAEKAWRADQVEMGKAAQADKSPSNTGINYNKITPVSDENGTVERTGTNSLGKVAVEMPVAPATPAPAAKEESKPAPAVTVTLVKSYKLSQAASESAQPAKDAARRTN